MSAAKDSPGLLAIAQRDERLFHIFSDYSTLKGEWEDIYVDFSGFFGRYGPQLFAAAPELLEALQPFVAHNCDGETITITVRTADVARARAAIAKAQGAAS